MTSDVVYIEIRKQYVELTVKIHPLQLNISMMCWQEITFSASENDWQQMLAASF